MYSETRKLRLVEKLLSIKNDSLLKDIESFIIEKETISNQDTVGESPSLYAGCISKNEAKDLSKQIEQSREEWERNI